MFQELLERAEWGADLPSVENNLQEHNKIHTAVEELMSGLQEARSYEVHTHTHASLIHEHRGVSADSHSLILYCPVLQAKVSANFKSSYSETLAKLEHQYCKLLVSGFVFSNTVTPLCLAVHPLPQLISLKHDRTHKSEYAPSSSHFFVPSHFYSIVSLNILCINTCTVAPAYKVYLAFLPKMFWLQLLKISYMAPFFFT